MSSNTDIIEGTDITEDEWYDIQDWLSDKSVDLTVSALTAMDLANLLEVAAGAGVITGDEHDGMNDLYHQLVGAVVDFKEEWASLS